VFSDKSKEWGIDVPSFTNGAAYADLDNDGDLELITNNIDQEVIVFENRANELRSSHYIKLRNKDKHDLNQKIWIYTAGAFQFFEVTPYRGFQSTVTHETHAGLGEVQTIDSIKIVWPDNKTLVYKNIKADTVLHYSKIQARQPATSPPRHNPTVHIEEIETNIVAHQERSPSDIKITRTLMHELSWYSPCIASGDVNNDSLDDFFEGGEKGQRSVLYIQQPDGQFHKTFITEDSLREDGDALFFDADNDDDLDLYVASACHSSIEEAREHILYLNNGKGNFSRSQNLPNINVSASSVIASDFDNDGDNDLFIGGRLKTKEYPLPPRSYVLRNDKGIFTDVTKEMHPALVTPGLVSSAVWADLNRDDRPDLVLAGEWMPIRVFINEGKTFSEQTEQFGLKDSNGWWNCLRAADLNNDGFPEIIAGNYGLNSFFEPTSENPIKIVAKDFDLNGSIDPVVTYYNPVEKDRFIIHNRLVLIDQIPGFKKRFEKFSGYAATPFLKAFRKEELENAYEARTSTLGSTILVNENGKRFIATPLPQIAQISSINDLLIEDFNNDGHLDLFIVGNDYTQETLFGRTDASLGCILFGNSKFNWTPLSNSESNLRIDNQGGEIRSLRSINGTRRYAISMSNAPVKIIEIKTR
jgi:hypothetical protein